MVNGTDLIIKEIFSIIILLGLFIFYKTKNKSVIKEALFNFRFDLKNHIKFILIPSMFSIILFVFLVLKFPNVASWNVPLWLLVASSVILAPITEEILIRGVILGSFLWAGTKIQNKSYKYTFLTLAFIFQLALFVFIHFLSFDSVFDLNRVVILSITGILYSSLFIVCKRNIAPSIISHSVWNLMVVLYSL